MIEEKNFVNILIHVAKLDQYARIHLKNRWVFQAVDNNIKCQPRRN